MTKTFLALTAAGLLLLAGCGTNEPTTSSSGSGGSSTTVAGASTSGPPATGGTAPPGTASTPGTTATKGCATTVAVVNAAAAKDASLKDRKLDVKTGWADQGPHPDNTVDYDATLEVLLAEHVLEKDKQFGYSIPVGVPTVPAEKVYVNFRLTATNGTITAGQTFVGSTSKTKADGTITTHSMYVGSNRLLPGDLLITITEITDDYVCGTISTTTKTDLQTFVGIEGSFKVTRIQSLEAAEK